MAEVAPQLPYEELRRRNVEENKRRLEMLNIGRLSAALAASAPPKPAPAKVLKRKAPGDPHRLEPVRRSTRVANLAEKPSYREVFHDVGEKVKRSSSYSGKRRDLTNRVYATDEEREYAITRADEIETSLGSEYATFVKPMLQSHVTGGFWLGLPTHFCRRHLPKKDETVTLVDEDDDEFDTVYLARKNGLSGGWRGFALHHQLVDGDALVFQLITRTKLKVYIVRGSDVYETT